MATKTFKLGEVCKGGVITVITKGNDVTVIGKDWDFSTGSRKSSNQKNAKEFTRMELSVDDNRFGWGMSMFLNNLTTSYHTDQIMKWIVSKVDMKSTVLHW